MGRQGAAEVTAAIGLYPNATLQGYVNRIGHALAATTERPGLPWEYQVVDDASVNAFALPADSFRDAWAAGAHDDEAELASVWATSGHGARSPQRARMSDGSRSPAIGLGVGSVFLRPSQSMARSPEPDWD
jgi:predicted Zn-dependent protease